METHIPSREEAYNLLREYTTSESLLRHALAVEGVMRFCARKRNEDENKWGIVGLVHDLDYEKYHDQHCVKTREILEEKGWPHFYLAGDTENRGELVKNFQQASGAAVFLISLKAGGFGLNLTAASYVVLYDPWWNPAVENQAIDRTHRIGQTSNVIAYRLLVKDTIEEKIRALQRTKRALADDVLGEESFAKSLTLEDLRFLFAGDAP